MCLISVGTFTPSLPPDSQCATASVSFSLFLMYESNPLFFSLNGIATWKIIRFSDISMTAERSVEMKFDGVFSELSDNEKIQFQGQVHNKLTPHVPKVVLDNYQCTEGRKTGIYGNWTAKIVSDCFSCHECERCQKFGLFFSIKSLLPSMLKVYSHNAIATFCFCWDV